MKTSTIFTALSLFFVGILSAQSVSGYGKISVSDFEKFPDNKYNLKTILIKNLEAKHYKIVEENPMDCGILQANVLNSSNMLRNRVTIQFKDCRNKIVGEMKGTSMEKDFETGYPDALQKALALVPVSNPDPENTAESKPEIKETSANIATEKPAQKAENSVKENNSQNVNVSNIYSNGNKDYQKIDISNGQFILVTQGSSVPFATFSKTTKEDTFRVVLEDKSMTLGYFENGNYVIEIPNADGSMRKEVFSRK